MKVILKSYAIYLFCLLLTGVGSNATAQLTQHDFQLFATAHKKSTVTQLQDFYSRFAYQPVWFRQENSASLACLHREMQYAPRYGLNEMKEEINLLERFRKSGFIFANRQDSIEAELGITAAALQFYNALAYGNAAPALSYNGYPYTPDCYDIPGLLAGYISLHLLDSLKNRVSQPLPEIEAIEKQLNWLIPVVEAIDFKEIVIVSNKVATSNKPLLAKLSQLGIIGAGDTALTTPLLEDKITASRQLFNLPGDSKISGTILKELNVPLRTRIKQLSVAVNYYRWLGCISQQRPVVVVNIPAAYLKVYHNGKTILEMKIVVGKVSTPTPTLSSIIREIILYPYWHVPNSIATKELLPILKRNPGYINEDNYQVINKAGKIIDPSTIQWKALSRSNFPYTLRQSTGCDNALGVLKLNFLNPFGVYLHDTPVKNAFMLSKRYLSHGCMRMEKPTALAYLLLKHNSIAIDTLEEKGCLKNQSPITVRVQEEMPVIVWYNMAGIDNNGGLQFYEDVYGKFDY